jgi:putative membrane protein
MANRPRFHAMSAIAALVLIGSFALGPAVARLPWAATSGTHFVEAIINADNYRMKAAALAVTKSPSIDIRHFAQELWADSIEDTRRLKWVVTKHDPYMVLPTQVTPHYLFVLDALVPVSGEDFDRRFMAQQGQSLREALALAEGYARAGDDFDLKEFARASVPTIKMKLDRITELQMQHQA